MSLIRCLLLAGSLFATAAVADVPSSKGRFGTLEVVSAGSEEALSFDDEVVGRPFGGELVDALAIVGRHQIGAEDVYIVVGSRGEACPARYVTVTTRKDAAPSVSAPFGSCAPILSSESRGGLSVTIPDADGSPVRYTYTGGRMREQAPLSMPGAALADMSQAPQRCRLYGQEGTSPTEGEALLAAFQREYPAALRKGGRVDRSGLSRDQLQAVVIGMACLSTWPGADPIVPETARPLFRNRRFGGEAFAMLDAVARAPDTAEPLRAAVRSFQAKMYYQASLEPWLG